MGAGNAASLAVGSSVFPTLTYVSGSEQRIFSVDHTPFSIGRKMDKDLVIADPRVSRDHALLVSENGRFFLEDQSSKHGTFVNGKKIDRIELERNDRIEFGSCDTVYAIFYPQQADSSTARDFLTRIPQINISNEATDLEKVTIFLEAARKLNTTGVLDEILVALLDMTLKLTGAERGYVFLKNETGDLKLAAGRNSRGDLLLDDTTVSHSIIQDALRANSEFLIGDTRRSDDLAARHSIVAFDLRTVICIPLRKLKVKTRGRVGEHDPSPTDTAIGALYVDSRFSSRDISKVSAGMLHGVASEAASLIENARLVQAEEASRRYQQELALAASIQQRLMAVTLPEVPFARLEGKNIPCNEIGGDFFDGVSTPDGLAMVLADVAGKGVSAALLASTLQGMIYSQLLVGTSLREIVTSANRFLTSKHIGEKFATVIIARLHPDGELEYVNCGHIAPLLIRENGEVVRLANSNLPIGVLESAAYESDRESLRCGDRLVLVTDGVTEAEDPEGDFFEEHRLEAIARQGNMQEIFSAVSEFCRGTPFRDDCTVVEMTFSGS